jgi:hypothetical protein
MPTSLGNRDLCYESGKQPSRCQMQRSPQRQALRFGVAGRGMGSGGVHGQVGCLTDSTGAQEGMAEVLGARADQEWRLGSLSGGQGALAGGCSCGPSWRPSG